MRFRICCRCNADEKKKTTDNGHPGAPTTVVPTVTEQPKPSEPIQLDRVTQVPVVESPIQAVQKEETPPPVTRLQGQVEQPSPQLVPPSGSTNLFNISEALSPPAGTKINVHCTAKSGETWILPFTVVAPGHYHCSCDGMEFTILNDKIQATDGAEDYINTEVILWSFMMALLKLKQGKLQIPESIQEVREREIEPPSMTVNTGNSKSTMSFATNIGSNAFKLDRIEPGYFIGTYKGKEFTITDGQLQFRNGDYNQLDKELIMRTYSACVERMQHGIKRMEAGMAQFVPSLTDKQFSPARGTPIHINITTRTGEKSVIPLTFIEPGHFRGQYDGVEFTILNGEILTDGDGDDLDKELILLNYSMAMKGMQRGLEGMRQGLFGMNGGIAGNATEAQPSHRVAETLQDELSRMRALIQNAPGLRPDQVARLVQKIDDIERNKQRGQNISNIAPEIHQKTTPSTPNAISSKDLREHEQVENTPQPRRMGTMLREMGVINDKEVANSRRVIDEDVLDMSNIPEPVLKKTTFTPNAVLYEDPKKYQPLDELEIQPAKRLDEYIISPDDSVKAGNRYYFHAAKPRRVTRKDLTPKQQLEVASLERYSLFERESLKVHNEYRKLHGVPPLVHNEFLCQVAREWAEHLALKNAFYHRPKNDYGENLYRAGGQDVCAKKAVAAWYDEIDLYDYNKPSFSKETGHFTQLVWKDTREMGTGVAQLGDNIWVCCNYHPPGNHLDKFNDEFIPRPLVRRVPKPN